MSTALQLLRTHALDRAVAAGCAWWLANASLIGAAGKLASPAPGVKQVGHIANPRCTESSGLVASRQHPGVFWTHNDGGGKRARLFGMTREGQSLAEFNVAGAVLDDWEDLALDARGHLLIGDFGNNKTKRPEVAVYEIPEPDPKARQGTVVIQRGWRLTFPKQPFDCESLFVWKDTAYVVSKVFDDQRAELYRFPLDAARGPHTLEFVTQLDIQSPVTGAALSADGRLLGLTARSGPFVYRIDGEPARAGQLKPWRAKFRADRMEGCCFVPEGLLTTTERREIFLFSDPACRTPSPP